MFYDQTEYEIRCEWGLSGLTHLLPTSDVIIIVDVLSFSTCVDVAVSRGGLVYPYRFRDESAAIYAESVGALLAEGRRNTTGYTLSPASLQTLPAGTRLVLPSPNGSTLTLATGTVPTFAGCLRNAAAVAQAAARQGTRITVVAAGERWPDGSLRPALEDQIGAGAIIAALPGSHSPEAEAARATFHHAEPDLPSTLRRCSSGKELIEQGFAKDVELAAQLNISTAVPILTDGAYKNRG
jgi:2-phosphosulfolactate phosphatase